MFSMIADGKLSLYSKYFVLMHSFLNMDFLNEDNKKNARRSILIDELICSGILYKNNYGSMGKLLTIQLIKPFA